MALFGFGSSGKDNTPSVDSDDQVLLSNGGKEDTTTTTTAYAYPSALDWWRDQIQIEEKEPEYVTLRGRVVKPTKFYELEYFDEFTPLLPLVNRNKIKAQRARVRRAAKKAAKAVPIVKRRRTLTNEFNHDESNLWLAAMNAGNGN